MSKRMLVEAIDISSSSELQKITYGLELASQIVARLVILHELTYEKAGNKHGMSKQAVYELLKRIYKKKYGFEYGKGESNTENSQAVT